MMIPPRIRDIARRCLGCALLLALPGESAHAQSANSTVTLLEEGVVSTGGSMQGGASLQLVTALGDPLGGAMAGVPGVLRAGMATLPLAPASGSRSIRVEGTVDDPTALLMVNGITATMTDNTFSAEGIQLLEGLNTLTVTATDPAGNRATTQTTVTLDPHPPAMPTLVSPPPVTTEFTRTLTGTKTPGTSVWINGMEVVLQDDATTWSATVSLSEGDNTLTIVTKDAAGNVSSIVSSTIIVDNLPPVVNALVFLDAHGQPLVNDPRNHQPKTNFDTVTLRGHVDDSLTVVSVGELSDQMPGREFELTLPLAVGPNALILTAVSPYQHVTTTPTPVMRGTRPTIVRLAPGQSSKFYDTQSVSLSLEAVDQEEDSLQYQFSVDGTVVMDWSANPSQSWALSQADRGTHLIEGRVRDAFGGDGAMHTSVYVLRKPIQPE